MANYRYGKRFLEGKLNSILGIKFDQKFSILIANLEKISILYNINGVLTRSKCRIKEILFELIKCETFIGTWTKNI